MSEAETGAVDDALILMQEIAILEAHVTRLRAAAVLMLGAIDHRQRWIAKPH